MSTLNFSCTQARQISLVDYLKTLGYVPQKVTNHDYWYLSPLREEKTPSFKVNRKLNVWYDHGLGQGGNFLDFGILYHRCSVKELLQKLADNKEQIFSFHPPSEPENELQKKDAGEKEKVRLIAVRELQSASLLQYLGQRRIPLKIASRYCKEVEFVLYNKRHTAIGFPNDSGGYELRNNYFKGSSSPKDFTFLEQETADKVSVFEGFFSFLSYQALREKESGKQCFDLPKEQGNYLILNSLAFLEKAREVMEKHPKIYLLLDRDPTGIKATLKSIILSGKYHDQSHEYRQYKDLNEYLIHSHKQQHKQSIGRGKHF
jgi:hypothetical protein